MENKEILEISKKLNIIIALSLRQLVGDKDFSGGGKRKSGIGDIVYYLADLGLDARDIAGIVGSPVQSIRTLLTPKRRK